MCSYPFGFDLVVYLDAYGHGCGGSESLELGQCVSALCSLFVVIIFLSTLDEAAVRGHSAPRKVLVWSRGISGVVVKSPLSTGACWCNPPSTVTVVRMPSG